MSIWKFIAFELFIVLFPLVSTNENAAIDLRKYFHELENDMTKVSWRHRCNSRAALQEALNSDVMMIEADIILGHLTGSGGGPPLPIMGHPPATSGDLSLEMFLTQVLQRRAEKGIKLDFKSISAFRASENILEQFLAKGEVDFPVWVNADILAGPGHTPGKDVVEPHYFLRTCVTKFPLATISAGWTVDVNRAQSLSYNSSHIDHMTSLLAEHHVVHPITFPVHAGIASNSVDMLSSLVHSSIDGTSLTLWCGEGEWLDYGRLRELIKHVGKDKVFVDMPMEMKNQLLNFSADSSATPAATTTVLISMVFIFSTLLSTGLF